jgi:toxin ParE1/3/4
MNHRLIIRPEAEADMAKAVVWYEDRERGLGLGLLSEFRAAIERVLQRPEAFTRVREQPAIHRILVRRFPYRIFYILTPDTVVVFAILHAARHEELWRNRL